MTRYDETDPTARVSRHEIEVPADPETVWEAIATGPGMATWFVPAEVDEREGGTIVTHHGPYGASVGTVTAWEPPHRFAYEERDWDPDAPDAPPWATEILVEARGGGTCVVRLVSGFFTGGDGWEEHLAGSDEGWATGMAILRLYLTHFAGLSATSMLVMGTVGGDAPEAARRLLEPLGLDEVAAGDRIGLVADAPPIEGVVERVDPNGVLLRTTRPHPGLVEIAAADIGATNVIVRGYLYGDGGAEVADREAGRWTTWLHEHFDDLAEIS